MTTMTTMTMTMMTMQEDRMMVDTEYSSDNKGADPAFTNYTHSQIARIIVMISMVMILMSIKNNHIHQLYTLTH